MFDKSRVVVIGNHKLLIEKLLRVMAVADEQIIVLGGVARNTYEIKMLPPIKDGCFSINPINQHGHWRQFEKRDKRKNFR